MIRVAICGTGTMGQLVLATIEAQDDLQPVGFVEPLAGSIDAHHASSDVTYPVFPDPAMLFDATHPDVVVDFTNAQFTPALVQAALAGGVRPVIGTSGVDAATIERLRAGSAAAGLGAVYAANFAIGAVLQMHMAAIASRFFDSAEIIELHHDQKVDSPSGTALTTARLMRDARGSDFGMNVPALEHLPHARGAEAGGVPIHSVRLPGFVASQEVIFGGFGQTLSLRHDTTGREAFMPGVIIAIREVMSRTALVEGLDALIGLG
ncbi:MAG: 4-hydroxy-tetrahydrodipicolinate reductase [Chloroflexi bacterium]|nr:MAG: 4-hydroxy-tetrahydrodipicolinate reductase [Chloroflexota bacterium]